jgi:hypothetical protein
LAKTAARVELSANNLLADVLKEMEKKTGLSVPSEAII